MENTETPLTAGSYEVKKAVTLVAKWAPAVNTILYITERGTKPAPDSSLNAGDSLTAANLPALTEEGYTFLGWYNGSTEDEANKVTAGNKMPSNGLMLTAKWQINTYKVTYQTVHGTAPDEITVDYGTKLSAAELATLEDAEYNFIGWYINDTETKVEAGSYTVKGPVTLVAHWAEKPANGEIIIEMSTTETLVLTYESTAYGYKFTAPAGTYTYKWRVNGKEYGTEATFVLNITEAPLPGEYTVHVTVYANGKAVNDAYKTIYVER